MKSWITNPRHRVDMELYKELLYIDNRINQKLNLDKKNMKQSMLKQSRSKGKIFLISIILIFLLSLFYCKKQEKKDVIQLRSVKYVGANTGVRLSKGKQDKAFGKWKFATILYTNDQKDSLKIKINKDVIINENGIFDMNNKPLAKKYKTVGTYQFTDLDSLNSRYYIFIVDEKKMIMNSSNLAKVVDGKLTKERAVINLFFIKK
ncbi:hypothetical protein [Elizabethkingia anophelis]|uniref:hypothetical protein n=3 Tax=Elizabethkingia anophelis TaxID=1117645 RepID=UPI0011786353|nr:hypothetical protein [Elizabethkingia anophelis]